MLSEFSWRYIFTINKEGTNTSRKGFWQVQLCEPMDSLGYYRSMHDVPRRRPSPGDLAPPVCSAGTLRSAAAGRSEPESGESSLLAHSSHGNVSGLVIAVDPLSTVTLRISLPCLSSGLCRSPQLLCLAQKKPLHYST